MTPEKLYQNLVNLDYAALVDKVFKLTEEQMIELNKNQLLKGNNAVGGKMPKYKSKAYAKKKKAKGSKAGGRVDLKLDNDFQEAFKQIIKSSKEVEITSTDIKLEMLEERFEENKIFGLNDKSLAIYTFKVFYPLFIKNLRYEITKN